MSTAETLIRMFVEYITEAKGRVPAYKLKQHCNKYTDRYGANRLYTLKSIAYWIVQSEYPHRDSPERRDILLDM